MANESPVVLTAPETATYLRINKSTLYALIKSDDFPAFKIGREWRVVKGELDVWLRKQCINK